jgi:hypothetical protein
MRLRKKRRGHRNGGKRGLKFVKTTIEGNLLGGRSRYFEVLRKENVQRGKGNTICLSVESQSIGLHTKRGSVRDTRCRSRVTWMWGNATGRGHCPESFWGRAFEVRGRREEFGYRIRRRRGGERTLLY